MTLPKNLEQIEAEKLLLDELDTIEREDIELTHRLSEDEAEQLTQYGLAI